ncbi:DUF6777 domain-containing protein [Streptomyces sp. NPDC001817]|uniref:DUF6777 domain-containing protein n=1 Tax=Streptomyces sp. NPDC001817 TaxID=3154398 RepID=UPI00331B94C7
MRITAGSIVTACALAAALLVAGCARPGVKEARVGEEVYLVPAAAPGPDPFTASTVTAPARTGGARADPATTGPPATGPFPPSLPAGSSPPVLPAGSSSPALTAGLVDVPLRAMRVVSGATPGLYGGTARVAGCDVERQIGYLTADRVKADAFARAAGVSTSGLSGHLRGLAPVVLRADTRVTGHGYRAGRPVAHQAVLQAGTAVLVDNRGVPRVRCACGNPLGSPAQAAGAFWARGSAWSGYRPGRAIAVTPAPRAVTSITIVDAGTRTWIERRIGHDVRHDRIVPAPAGATAAPAGAPDPAAPGTAPPYPALPGPDRRQSPPDTAPGTTVRPPPAVTRTAPNTPGGRSTPDPDPDTAGPRSAPSLGSLPEAPGGPDPPHPIGPPDASGPPSASDAPGAAGIPGAPVIPGAAGIPGAPVIPGAAVIPGVPETAEPPAVGGPLSGGPPGPRPDAVPDATDGGPTGGPTADLTGGSGRPVPAASAPEPSGGTGRRIG